MKRLGRRRPNAERSRKASARRRRVSPTSHLIALSPTGFVCSCGEFAPRDKTFPALANSVMRLKVDVSIELDDRAANDLTALLSKDRWSPAAGALRHQFTALLQEPMNDGKAIATNCLRCDAESTLAAVLNDETVVVFTTWLRTPCGSCGKTPIEAATINPRETAMTDG